MLQNEFQGHSGSDGSSEASRISDAGYDWIRIAENVFAYAQSVPHGHAGFEVDWGENPDGTPIPGGMQIPPGHRLTIHNPDLREIGVGVVHGQNGSVGPQIVTQDFGTQPGATPFITGVVFYDINGNQFYDLGEGIGGATVQVASATTHAVTARSGGYSVPVPGDGTYSVTFSLSGLAEVEKSVTVANGANAKLDHAPAYSAPVIGGSTVAFVNRDNSYVFSPVGAATAHEWRSAERIPWLNPEGAETGLGRFEADVSPGYDVVSTSVHQAGTASFRLAHPQPPRTQSLTTRNPLRLGANSELSFASRLGIASEDEVARAQVSTDGGLTWTDIWTQAGAGNPGEQTFSIHRVGLSDYAGRNVHLRFEYSFNFGNYFPPGIDAVGWYLDEVLIADAEELTVASSQSVVHPNAFVFRPNSPGEYLLEVRPLLGDRPLPWGPSLAVTARQGGPAEGDVRLTRIQPQTAGGWLLDFQADLAPNQQPGVEAAASIVGPWNPVASASIESTGSAGAFRARVPEEESPARFFRIAVQ
jgi:hypothetical protein